MPEEKNNLNPEETLVNEESNEVNPSSDESVQYNPNNRQKMQEQLNASTDRKMGETAARAADLYFTGGTVGKAVDAAEKIPIAGGVVKGAKNQLFDAVGKPIGQAIDTVDGVAGTDLRGTANEANKAGAFDMANSAMSMAGGGADGAAGSAAGNAAGGIPGGTAPAGGGAPGIQAPSQEPSIDVKTGQGANQMELEMPDNTDLDENDTQVDNAPKQTDDKDGLVKKGSKTIAQKIIVSIIWKPVAIGIGVFLLITIIVAIASPNMGAMLDLTSGTTGNEVLAAGMQNTYTDEQIESMLVYVGDSRTVGLNYALNNSDIAYVAEPAIGYDWFLSTGKLELDNYLTTNQRKFIVINFGINDLHNIDRYINLYNGLINANANIQFYFMSVNPVDEALAVQNGYNVKNSDIQAFNTKLSEAFGDKYIDTYKSMQNYFSSSDGVHYDNQTYIRLHHLVLDYIKSKNKFSIGITDFPSPSETEMLEGKSLLDAIGDSGIKELEAYINSNVIQGGQCTGNGVAAAGASLIYGLHQKGFHLPYYWGGGHGGYIFVDPTWGAKTTPRVSSGGNTYYYNGFDCSGFVTWSLKTANVEGGGVASSFLSFGTKITYEEASPGDVLVNPGHIILVIENKGSYLQTAESTNGGVQFSQTTKDKIERQSYSVISMNDYYTKNCKG